MTVKSSVVGNVRNRSGLIPSCQTDIEILLVEDNIMERPFWDGVCGMLAKEVILDHASTYEGAEHMLLNRQQLGNPYDLIIIDVFLSSEKTGIDLWMNHGDKGLYSRHPVLFISAANDETMFDLFSSNGFAETPPYFLQKPLRLNECVDTIERLLWWCF